jgi:uncharacterized protein YaaW (UPF0174 family)
MCPPTLRLATPAASLPSMSQGRSDVTSDSRKKGLVAGAAAAATVTLGVLGAPVLAGVAAVPAAFLAYKWWKHRAENGIKF